MTKVLRHSNMTLRLCFLLLSVMMSCAVRAHEQLDCDLRSDTVSYSQDKRADSVQVASAQTADLDTVFASAIQQADSIEAAVAHTVDSLSQSSDVQFAIPLDTVAHVLTTREKGRFIPDPKKAMWLAMIIPGGGQIYNRKYWKLPLIYGGFLGCVYAMTWNNTMYRDYSQAYIDIMDNDENTKSYENFLPDHYDVKANEERLKDLFKRKKNFYRRYRDLSMFCMIGVYALSILDAYIDAEMSSFDISDDLTLKVRPAVIHDKHTTMRAPGVSTTAYGVGCSFSF